MTMVTEFVYSSHESGYSTGILVSWQWRQSEHTRVTMTAVTAYLVVTRERLQLLDS